VRAEKTAHTWAARRKIPRARADPKAVGKIPRPRASSSASSQGVKDVSNRIIW